MKNKIIFTISLCFISLSLLVFSSCTKNYYEEEAENTLPLELTTSNVENIVEKPQTWHITNKRFCVVLGYGFNTEEKIKETKELLQNRYGLAEDGGLIYTLTFPDDFKSGGRSYHNNLRLILQNDIENLSAVIILGAPEKTHYALARNQDFWNMKVPYPVVALFPQDDVLGLESTCDIVIDKSQTSDFENNLISEEQDGNNIPEANDVLINTIDYLLTLEGPLEKNNMLSNHVLCMLKNYKIHHYIDPETGLQSINHFVLN